jgi:hypothetical protein
MLRTSGKAETAQASSAWAVIADQPRQELQHSTELYCTTHPSFYPPREQFAQQALDRLRVRPFRMVERLPKRTIRAIIETVFVCCTGSDNPAQVNDTLAQVLRTNITG